MTGRRLEGKVAFISGGAGGIGRATAERFSVEGAVIVIADVDEEAGARACATNPNLSFEPLDVTSDASWTAAVDRTLSRHGRLDVLVNGAGIVVVKSIEDITESEWRRVQAVNVDGVFLGCRHAVRAMKATGGSIINPSSVSGLVGGHNLVAYNAAKGAVRLLTKSVALHCARKGYGIRCNSVHPGFVETPMLDDLVRHARDPVAARERLVGAIPLGRTGTAEEIAALLVYLASDESAFVTGAELVIDGGLTAQ